MGFWDAIVGSLEVGTRCRDPETGGNIGEVCLDGLYALGMVRFHRYLRFLTKGYLKTTSICGNQLPQPPR